MKQFITAIVILLMLASPLPAGEFAAPPDPFFLNDNNPLVGATSIYRGTVGLTPRSQSINPAQKTLVMIVDGQSQAGNVAPTTYIPTNSSAIDNFNIYDGASYPVAGPLLGAQYNPPVYGGGNLAPKIADKFVTNANFDRVILVPMAVGATQISDHSTGSLSGRIGVVMARLASRGITPATTGTTWAYLWMQGETDEAVGTTQVNYAAGLATVLANAIAAGFSGRMFVAEETWNVGVTSAAVQAAQVAFVNGTTVFSASNMDAIGAGSRFADQTHLNDAGQATFATTAYNAMHASGAPF